MQHPPGQQHLVRIRRIPSDDARGTRIEHLERGTAFIPRHRLGRHAARDRVARVELDRKSTRLNSSHGYISYAVFCLKKKNHCSIVLVALRSNQVAETPETAREAGGRRFCTLYAAVRTRITGRHRGSQADAPYYTVER